MPFKTRLVVTRPSTATPFFNEVLPPDDSNPIRAAFDNLENARTRAGFAMVEGISNDNLTRTVEIDYGNRKVYQAFISRHERDYAIVRDARRAYYGMSGLAMTFTLPKE